MAPPNNVGADIVAAAETDLVTVGANGGTYSVLFCNRSSTVTAKVRLGISVTTSFEDARYLWFDETVLPFDSIEWSGIPMKAGEHIIVQSDVSSVNAVAMGFNK